MIALAVIHLLVPKMKQSRGLISSCRPPARRPATALIQNTSALQSWKMLSRGGVRLRGFQTTA